MGYRVPPVEFVSHHLAALAPEPREGGDVMPPHECPPTCICNNPLPEAFEDRQWELMRREDVDHGRYDLEGRG